MPIYYPTGGLEGVLPSGALNDPNNLILSKTSIQVLDLLGEGEMEGLVTGTYIYSGNVGDVGYKQAIFYPYSGAPSGAANSGDVFLPSVFWNGVPVVNSQNQYNYQRVDIGFTPGFPNGDTSSQNNTELTISRTLGERLFGSSVDSQGNPIDVNRDFTKYYTIYNKDCKGVIVNIKFPTLLEQVTQGDQAGTIIASMVEYKIWYRPIYSLSNSTSQNTYTLGMAEQVVGLINYGYIRASRVNFISSNSTDINSNIINDPSFIGWEIKILRTTADSTTSFVRNQSFVDSLTEIYNNSFSYPNSAIVSSSFEAEFFSQVPARAYDIKGMKVLIPSNYDPITKQYTETGPNFPNGWDGTFHSDRLWTDNPAWCYYDLLTNARYGLGKYINTDAVDKWTLYEIAKYCDKMVADGYGGVEPLFSCNMLINSRDDAYKVINDLASIFRAITYYGFGGSIYAVQDSPKVPIFSFNNTNVEDGNFTYSTSSKRVRHTVAVVRYNDKNNFYKPAIEYVEDTESIRRYGIRQLDITAFGCTSRGQAIRLGKWAILSENLETETVSFTAGMDAIYLRPGDVFNVFDLHRKNKRYGGRTYRIDNLNNTTNVTLDNQITLNTGIMYNFSLLTPGYFYDTTQVSNLSGIDFSGIRRNMIQKLTFTGIQSTGINSGRSIISFNQGFDTGSYLVTGNLVWSIELSSGIQNINDAITYTNPSTDYYRAIKVSEKDDLRYDVVGLQYANDKYLQIESGLNFDRPSTQYAIVPSPPDSLALTVISPSANTKAIQYDFIADNTNGVTNYKVFAKDKDFSNSNVPDNSYLISTLPTNGIKEGQFIPQVTGDYYFRVYSYNSHAKLYSNTAVSAHQEVKGINSIRDVVISSLEYSTDTSVNSSADRSTGAYINFSPTFKWNVGITENSFVVTDLKYRVTIRQPSANNIPSSVIYYENDAYIPPGASNNSPLKNNQFQFDINTNTSITNGPYRNYDIVVEAIDAFGNTSAGNSLSPLVDNNWTNFPAGYDIFGATNPAPTGFNLSSGINYNLQAPWEIYDTFSRRTNNTIIVNVGNRAVPNNVIGGFAFYSDKPFSGLQVITGKKIDGAANQFLTNNNQRLFQKKTNFFPSVNSASFVFDASDLNGAIGKIPNTLYFGMALYDAFDDYFLTQNSDSSNLKTLWQNPGSGLSGCYNVIGIDSQSKVTTLSIAISGTQSGDISILSRPHPTNSSLDQIGYYDVSEANMPDTFTIISTRPRVDPAAS